MRPWNPNTKSAGRPGDWTPPLRQTVPAGAHCASAHWATEADLSFSLFLNILITLFYSVEQIANFVLVHDNNAAFFKVIQKDWLYCNDFEFSLLAYVVTVVGLMLNDDCRWLVRSLQQWIHLTKAVVSTAVTCYVGLRIQGEYKLHTNRFSGHSHSIYLVGHLSHFLLYTFIPVQCIQ